MWTPGQGRLGLHPGSITCKVVNLKLIVHLLYALVSLTTNGVVVVIIVLPTTPKSYYEFYLSKYAGSKNNI